MSPQKSFRVMEPLSKALVGGALRAGSIVTVGGESGTSSLLLALLSAPITDGSWAAAVHLPTLGLEAAVGLGVDLSRLVLVPRPGRSWPEIVAALIDVVDLIVLNPPSPIGPRLASRLEARVRERNGVLVVARPSLADARRCDALWPLVPDVALQVRRVVWSGIGSGHGVLSSRTLTVCTSPRRGSLRAWETSFLLPGATGGLEAFEASSRTVEQVDEAGSYLERLSS